LARLRREAAETAAAFFAADSAAAEHAGLRPRAAPAGPPRPEPAPSPSPLAPLVAPVEGEVVRRYGEAWPGRGRSEGLSWRTAASAEVRSPSDGRIEYAGPLKNWGLVLIIRRPDGWRAVLAGLQRADLAPGAAVRSGELLGRMGRSASPAPELYLELRRGADPVDPGPYVLRPRRIGEARPGEARAKKTPA
jgi:septal ring factor EnvC (AmiA/AmiB activator)